MKEQTAKIRTAWVDPANGSVRVGLFVTCLVDLMRPQIGFAAIQLLQSAGCTVSVPRQQTCCGQPAYNSGDHQGAVVIARQVIPLFEEFDYVVVPSGSCAGTLRTHYPELLKDDPVWLKRAQSLAAKTHELLSFLADIRRWRPQGISLDLTAAYHDSCSGLRELGIANQPRRLLSDVAALRLKPLRDAQTCCGFGGTFCVKYPDVSNAIARDKAVALEESGADVVLGGDLGCLMLMAGTLRRRKSRIRAFHAAEVLAGMADGPAIGEQV